MMLPLVSICIVALLVAGCSDLIVRDGDDGGTVAGKVSARVLLGLATIGISEVEISNLGEKEERQARDRKAVENLNQAIGVLTYDQALQRLGPPSSIAEGRDVTVAVWQGTPGPMLLVPMPPVGFGQAYLAGQMPAHGIALTFSPSVFDPDQKVLRSWRAW